MKACLYPISSIEQELPIANLGLRRVKGEKMLVAEASLSKGCHVAPHHHESEQFAVVLSGKVKWTFGEPGGEQYEEIVEGGTIVHLPSNVWHGVDAIEDTYIIDILSPPSAMGVDSQKK